MATVSIRWYVCTDCVCNNDRVGDVTLVQTDSDPYYCGYCCKEDRLITGPLVWVTSQMYPSPAHVTYQYTVNRRYGVIAQGYPSLIFMET